MNPFDTTELDKKIAEAEAALINGDEATPEKEEEVVEKEEEQLEEAEMQDEELEEEKEEVKAEEEKKPSTPAEWKEWRNKKKEAQKQVEEEKKLREQKEREVYELKERLARLEGREEARAKPIIDKEPQDAEPDRDLDPDAHRDWRIRQLEKRTIEAEKRAEEATALAKVEGIRRGLSMVEKDYVKNNKIDDYEARIEHVKTVERNLIKLRYPTATDEQINSHLEGERIKLANDAYSKGQNPAEMFVKMSETLGYRKADSKKDTNDKPNIEAINRNMKKNTNLIGSSNVEKPGGISSEKLVSMSITDLLDAKNEKALDAAIRREESKLWG